MPGDDLIACVLQAHEVLGRESDLSPLNPRINAALSALVQGVMDGCLRGDAARVLADPRIGRVRAALVQRLALAEGAMERHWTRAFCQRRNVTAADFEQFTYWDCYRHLVEAELGSLGPHLELAKAESIAFVGAGPLPLSAILAHLGTGLKATCLDVDAEACSLARALCRKVGLTGIEVRCASGAHHDYALHPVVMIASLVAEKADAMRRIRATRPGAVVALRSAEGLCTLLYDPVDETELAELGCGYLGRTSYNPQVINTTLIYAAAPMWHKPVDGARREGRLKEIVPAAQ
jgi:protein-L-isoaspartate O-methyltransferase